MSTYCRIVIDKPYSAVESTLLSAFGAERLLPVSEAEPGDFLLLEGNGCISLDEFDSSSFIMYVAMEPEFLTSLSKACDAKITAIAVNTNVAWVSILVVDRGRIIRRYLESDEVEIDEGNLPEWDERIHEHSWNAADALVEMAQHQPEPSLIGRAFRTLAGVSGFLPKSKRTESLAKFGFGEPIAAISAKRFHAERNLRAVDCRFEASRLICTLDNGSELSFLPADIESVLIESAFKTNQILFSLRDRRVMSLPAAYASEFPAIERWWKSVPI